MFAENQYIFQFLKVSAMICEFVTVGYLFGKRKDIVDWAVCFEQILVLEVKVYLRSSLCCVAVLISLSFIVTNQMKFHYI